MKLTILKSTIVAAFLTLLFAVAASAQADQMTGAYGDISVRSSEAKAAAALAVKEHSATHAKDKVTLIKVLKAEQQVVAGMNYRVCMLVKNRKGVKRTVTAVVYKPLRKRMRTTDWETGGCREI